MVMPGSPVEGPLSDLELTDDAFLGGQLHILQPKSGYRAGVDAVLLSATVPTELGAGAAVLDLGAGVGTVGLSAASRLGQIQVTLVEAEPEMAALAVQNIARNGLLGRARSVTADVTGPASLLEAAGVPADFYACVVANPPFHAEGQGTPAPGEIKAAAHAMPADALDRWVRAMARHAAPGGTAIMVHKVEALGEILAAFSPRFGAVRVLPVHPRAGANAIRVIVSGIKGSRAPLAIRAGFVLHEEGHTFTAEAAKILRAGGGLVL